MDFNYYSAYSGMSLQTMCIVKVVHEILKASRCALARNEKEKLLEKVFLEDEEIQTEAMARMKMLGLARRLEEMTKSLLKPMTKELCLWFRNMSFETGPIVTSWGTIDVTKSMRAHFENQKKDDGSRKCSEFVKPKHWSMFAKLSVGVYERHFDVLSPSKCYLHLIQALFNYNDFAVRYFVDKVCHRDLHDAVMHFLLRLRFKTHCFLLPSTVILLISKLVKQRCEETVRLLSVYLLFTLLQWPYQRLFMQALPSIISKLCSMEYDRLAKAILEKVSNDYQDWDYLELHSRFVEVAEANNVHKVPPRYSAWGITGFEPVL